RFAESGRRPFARARAPARGSRRAGRVLRARPARSARGARPDGGAGRRSGGRGRNRPARADAAAGFARGGVHEPHPRRARGRVRRGGGGGVSTLAPIAKPPRLDVTGRVTFSRVLLSEWTKLRSVRSTKWSLGVGFLLTIAFPILFAIVTRTHWG